MKSSLHILLTGNDEIIHTSLRDYLRNLGHQVEVTRDGYTLLKRISAQNYNLALVDLRIPDINGIELLTKIQQNGQDMRVVLISGTEIMKTLIETLRLDEATILPQSIQPLNFDTERNNGGQTNNLDTKPP